MSTKASTRGARWKGKEEEGYSNLIEYFSNMFSGEDLKDLKREAAKAKTPEEAERKIEETMMAKGWNKNAVDNTKSGTKTKNARTAIQKEVIQGRKIIVSRKEADRQTGQMKIFDANKVLQERDRLVQEQAKELTPSEKRFIESSLTKKTLDESRQFKEVEDIIKKGQKTGDYSVTHPLTTKELKQQLSERIGTVATDKLKTRKELEKQAKIEKINVSGAQVTVDRWREFSKRDKLIVMNKSSELNKLIPQVKEVQKSFDSLERQFAKTGDDKYLIEYKKNLSKLQTSKKPVVTTDFLAAKTKKLNDLVAESKSGKGKTFSFRLAWEIETGKSSKKYSDAEIMKLYKKQKLTNNSLSKQIADVAIASVPNRDTATIKDVANDLKKKRPDVIKLAWTSTHDMQKGPKVKELAVQPVVLGKLPSNKTEVQKVFERIGAVFKPNLFNSKLKEVKEELPYINESRAKQKAYQLVALESGAYPEDIDTQIKLGFNKSLFGREETKLGADELLILGNMSNKEIGKLVEGPVRGKQALIAQWKDSVSEDVEAATEYVTKQDKLAKRITSDKLVSDTIDIESTDIVADLINDIEDVELK